MRSSNWSFLCLVVGASVLGGCAPSADSGQMGRIEFALTKPVSNKTGLRTQSASSLRTTVVQAGNTVSVTPPDPGQACFAVHVTGPGHALLDHPGFQSGCKTHSSFVPENWGLLKGSTTLGGQLSLEVPVGLSRRFDIVMVSPDVFGGACPSRLSLEPSKDPTKAAGEPDLIAYDSTGLRKVVNDVPA